MSVDGVAVYTDGACSGNPGPGGWAWAVPHGRWASGAVARTTNQRMELTAVLEALRALPGHGVSGPLAVHSDSTYVVHCFRDRWWEGWLRRGWLNAKKEPVANRDLWEPLIELVRARGDVTFTWVKGHGGDPFNDLVDRLAVEAATRQEGRSGVGVPGELGPPDSPAPTAAPGAGAAPAPGEGAPAGHRLVIAGHKPPELGGYARNQLVDLVRRRLTEILRAHKVMHPEVVVLTGLGLGAEQLGAEAAVEAGVPYVAVLAFPGVEGKWPAAARRRFATLVDGAAEVITLEPEAPSSPQAAGMALGRRDAWLARHAQQALVVWDRRDPNLARLVRSFEDHLGETEVWVVVPDEA